MTNNASVTLMDHQREGIDFLVSGQAGLLAFEQGLGKTLVAIEAFRRVFQEGGASRMLVICPNSLKKNWVAEIGRFAPEFTTEIVQGAPRARRQQFVQTRATIVITSYETARTETTALIALLKRERAVLALDESHSAKTWRSLTSTSVRHLAPHCVYRWLLSGTPVTNSPADLYTQIEILAPGKRLLGSMDAFVASAEDNPAAAHARVAPLVLRRTKEQCLDLPEKTFIDVRVELPDWQRKIYDEIRTDMAAALKRMSPDEYKKFASTALAKLTRLTQVASNPALIFPDRQEVPGKFLAIDGALEDIMAVPDRKVIIWSNYISTIEALVKRYQRYGAVALYGEIPASDRQGIADKFQKDEETRVLIANPAAAGTGFTLTAANFTIYETLSWRYDFYAQSQDRNHRIGQSLPVTYLRIIAADTIEEIIIKALHKKTAMAGELLGDGQAKPSLSDLTQEEMYQLIMNNELPDA